MLDIKFVRANPEIIKQDLEKRNETEMAGWVDEIIERDKEYREQLQVAQELRHKRNEITNEINKAKKENLDITELLNQAKEIPEKIKQVEEFTESLKNKINWYLMRIPNVTHETVPVGKDDSENVEVRRFGEIKKPDFELLNHGELIEKLDLADFKRAAKVAGSGFYYLKGKLAQLNFALQRYALDFLIQKGWTIVQPPVMMNRASYEGVTSLGDFEDVMYKIEDEDLYLIATSEHPLGAMYMNEVLQKKELPLRLAGVSPCFRREIGSHGVDTKGIFRVHQFDKIEQFVFCTEEESWQIHEEILANAEELFQNLEIPYRVVNVCTGDLGIIASKKYDIEAWSPRQDKFIEVVSCSNCTSYQAVRLNIRYQKDEERTWVHTLNSTAIATSRALVAILENFQNEDGSVTIPKVLRPYMNNAEKIE